MARVRTRVMRSSALAVAVMTGVAATTGAGVAAEPLEPRVRLPVLRGWVGPSYDISLSRSSVPAGRYRLVVKDLGTQHNFHFFGEGVNVRTDVTGTGRSVWRVTLTPGVYVAECEPHGSMTVELDVT